MEVDVFIFHFRTENCSNFCIFPSFFPFRINTLAGASWYHNDVKKTVLEYTAHRTPESFPDSTGVRPLIALLAVISLKTTEIGSKLLQHQCGNCSGNGSR
jgi:hypothetical protein